MSTYLPEEPRPRSGGGGGLLRSGTIAGRQASRENASIPCHPKHARVSRDCSQVRREPAHLAERFSRRLIMPARVERSQSGAERKKPERHGGNARQSRVTRSVRGCHGLAAKCDGNRRTWLSAFPAAACGFLEWSGATARASRRRARATNTNTKEGASRGSGARRANTKTKHAGRARSGRKQAKTVGRSRRARRGRAQPSEGRARARGSASSVRQPEGGAGGMSPRILHGAAPKPRPLGERSAPAGEGTGRRRPLSPYRRGRVAAAPGGTRARVCAPECARARSEWVWNAD